MISEEVKSSLEELRLLRQPHSELVVRLLQVDGQAHWPMDLLTVSSLNRSLNLLAGFSTLIEGRNIVSAMPLLRVELDCAIRLSAAWHVRNPHHFAWQIIQGAHVRNLKSQDGKLMRDRYLVDKLSGSNPWVNDVYKYTSGYVHLSDQHFLNSYRTTAQTSETATINLRVATGDEHVADQYYLDTISRFGQSARLFLSFAERWVATKEDPDQTGTLAAFMQEVRSDIGHQDA